MDECTLILPALNEADNIQHVLAAFPYWPRSRIIVVDNGSDDATASVAADFGVVVLQEPRRGKGFAVVTGARWAQTDHVFLCDADIKGITGSHVSDLMSAFGEHDVLARLSITRTARVTHMTAKPLLSALGMDCIAEPIGGLALVSRRFLLEQHLHGGWGFDIDLTIPVLQATGKILEVDTPGISHQHKATSSLNGMATDVLRAGMQTAGLIPWDHNDCAKCCQ